MQFEFDGSTFMMNTTSTDESTIVEVLDLDGWIGTVIFDHNLGDISYEKANGAGSLFYWDFCGDNVELEAAKWIAGTYYD